MSGPKLASAGLLTLDWSVWSHTVPLQRHHTLITKLFTYWQTTTQVLHLINHFYLISTIRSIHPITCQYTIATKLISIIRALTGPWAELSVLVATGSYSVEGTIIIHK